MLQAGYAQEIITPPTGVGLAGYFNARPNEGMYDDLYVKVVAFELGGKRFGLVTFDLCKIPGALFERLETGIIAKFGRELYEALILSATHTHTGPALGDAEADERTRYALDQTAGAALRAIERAFMNLLPAELEAGSVYNNPYGFVRRYWMKNHTIVTNPGWGNPDIDRPESDFDRTINIVAVKQGGRIAALLCNICNHGDTIGGNLVSADWYGRFVQEIQHQLTTGLPVLIFDDCSGNVNHFDFRQKINQTSYAEAVRIGRGYAAIVLGALKELEPVSADAVKISNTRVEIPHRRISPEELAAARRTLETVPDIPKGGDLESQDLANGVPAALRYFAQRVIDCHDKSRKSHSCRLTSIVIGNELAFVSLPGEPFNGVSQAIRAAGGLKYTFVVELAQSVSGYLPMPECFERGGYEVQPAVDSVAPEAATELIRGALDNLGIADHRGSGR